MRLLIGPLLQDPGPRSLALRQHARLFSLLLVLSAKCEGARKSVLPQVLPIHHLKGNDEVMCR